MTAMAVMAAIFMWQAAQTDAPNAPVVSNADVQRADAPSEAPKARGQNEMLHRFFPLALTDGAAAPVADNMLVYHLISIIPFGGLFAGLLLYPPEGRPQLGTDVILSWLVPTAITLGVVFVGSSVFWVSSFLCPFLFIGSCMMLPVGVLGWYVANTAAMNAWDRAYKGKPIARAPKSAPDARMAMAY